MREHKPAVCPAVSTTFSNNLQLWDMLRYFYIKKDKCNSIYTACIFIHVIRLDSGRPHFR